MPCDMGIAGIRITDEWGARRRRRTAVERRNPAIDVAVDGSLAGRMKGTAAAGNLRAKTGTMSNIRTLAGYVTTRDGERLAFAVLINNFEGTGTNANDALDAIAVRLASFSRTNQN